VADRTVNEIMDEVRNMVEAKVLIPEYEVVGDSYVCFVVRANGKTMLHAGRMAIYPNELQNSFLGLFLNERWDDYKIIGIYRLAEWSK
jgi:hypothetical protein